MTSMSKVKPMWTDETRTLMTAVLNEIIPANADGIMPAAGTLGVSDFIIGELEKDGTHRAAFERGLKRLKEICSSRGAKFCTMTAQTRIAVLKQLETEDEAYFQLLIRYTYMGYYSRPDIRALMQLSAKPVHPDGYDVAPETAEQLSELTRPVIERGPCYRSC